ncbi:LPXTG cell wall anchor domain-containing protein [Streptomyces sp. ISL-90]|nr:LPXTG cell wall anchor domain-containing protein [Streptomyces sp. ISL-90]
MHSRKGLAERHEGRPESFQDNQTTTEDRQRWRRTLAAIAISALAVGGMSALVASPAAADEATPPATAAAALQGAGEENAKKAADEAAAAAALQAAEEENAKKAADEAAAAAAAALQATEAENAKKAADEAAAAAAAALQATEAENANKAAEEESSKKAEELDGPVELFLVPPDPNVEVDKVEICHSTGSHQNPYVINEPAADGDVSGHADHDGPIWFPGIEEEWGDIIPPFTYDGGSFPGLNWSAEGQAIFANDCKIPPPAPPAPPVLSLTSNACPVHGGTGTVTYSLASLQNATYRVTVLNSQGGTAHSQLVSGLTGTAGGSIALPPGNYTFQLAENDPFVVLAEQAFTIGACPAAPPAPAPVVPVKTLAATGTETAGPLMAGGMIMLLMGGAALIAANRRRWGTSRSE